MPVKKRSMKEALTQSLRSEGSSVEKRFEKAERMFRGRKTERPAVVKAIPVERVIRDNYSMPSTDYEMISALRERCLKAGVSVTKSEVLRAGLHALDSLSNQELLKVFSALKKLKPGRRAAD